MKKILVLGYFGYVTNQLDGQTVKTRDIYNLLREHLKDKIIYYDTQEFKFNKASIFNMFWLVAKSNNIIYLPAQNNLKYIFPIIWIITKLNHSKIHYFIIGGWLSKFLRNLPIHRFLLKHINGIYSETSLLKKELNEFYGINNVTLFHNFRHFESVPIEHHIPNKLQIVFMARICKAKGIEMIFSLGKYLKAQGLMDKISIDFYGQISPDDQQYFQSQISKFSFITYKGVLKPDCIHETLQKYDVLVLPTHYPGEGLPGSIIDAYISGIPVIVTNFKYATEFVEDNKNGIIIPYDNGQTEFNDAVLSLLKDEKKLHHMKKYASASAYKFSEKVAWEKLQNILSEY